VSVGHAVNEIDEQEFSEGNEFGSMIERPLLYIITQIGELWHRRSPWGSKY